MTGRALKRTTGKALALMLMLLLAGCGFQLRGEAQLPAAMERTYIAAIPAAPDLPRQLKLLLTGNDIEVVGSQTEASAVLVILEDRITREVLSVGASARVREFALNYAVRFRLDDKDGNPLLAEQVMTLRDDYQFDQQQVVGTASEEELLRREMVRTMAREILRRLELAG
jgi:LPS-assembly lipoprotein